MTDNETGRLLARIELAERLWRESEASRRLAELEVARLQERVDAAEAVCRAADLVEDYVPGDELRVPLAAWREFDVVMCPDCGGDRRDEHGLICERCDGTGAL